MVAQNGDMSTGLNDARAKNDELETTLVAANNRVTDLENQVRLFTDQNLQLTGDVANLTN